MIDEWEDKLGWRVVVVVEVEEAWSGGGGWLAVWQWDYDGGWSNTAAMSLTDRHSLQHWVQTPQQHRAGRYTTEGKPSLASGQWPEPSQFDQMLCEPLAQ